MFYLGIVMVFIYWSVNFLYYKFLFVGKLLELGKFECIYISCNLGGSWRIINEYEVVEVLEKLGFIKVYIEDLFIVEIIELMLNVKVVVIMYGGGCSNLLFCNLGIKVIEIFLSYYVMICYYIFSNYLGL